MRTVTIRELHMKTGQIVRDSAHEQILITDHGRPIALLQQPRPAEMIGKLFPKRDRRKMPKVPGDSTIFISQDRDGR